VINCTGSAAPPLRRSRAKLHRCCRSSLQDPRFFRLLRGKYKLYYLLPRVKCNIGTGRCENWIWFKQRTDRNIKHLVLHVKPHWSWHWNVMNCLSIAYVEILLTCRDYVSVWYRDDETLSAFETDDLDRGHLRPYWDLHQRSYRSQSATFFRASGLSSASIEQAPHL